MDETSQTCDCGKEYVGAAGGCPECLGPNPKETDMSAEKTGERQRYGN